ncbi:hypothetical protein [Maricaulis salignorans]|uniref:hypothetical protein n=1 Tax=Maricaulis salignorans TaxID=144026 RepID=UPI003A952A96
MSATQFQVVFDGPALAKSEMDSHELGASLISLNHLFDEADSLLNNGRTTHRLKVRGSFKRGCFKIDFASDQKLIERVQELLGSSDVQSIIAAGDLVNYLIVGTGAGMVGLFGLVKWLAGQQPTKIIEDAEGGLRVYKGDKYIKTEDRVIELFRSYKVRKALESAIAAPLTPGRVTDIAFTKDGGKTFERATIDDRAAFIAPPEEPSAHHTFTYDANVSLVNVSFKEGNQWRVHDGTANIGVYVEDRAFLEKVDANEISFSKGDVLRVRLRIEQDESPTGDLKNAFFVEEVLDHRHPEFRGQSKMTFDQSSDPEA